MPPITRLDHVVIAVRSLDAAAATYRKLGFTLTPRGLHEGKGTGNHCIMFGSTYIELLGIVDETGAKGRLAERVNARGEGGMAIAYGADDADQTYAALKAAGIEAEPPNDLARPLDLDGKRDMVRFRNIMLPKLALPDTMQFVCTHVTPELTRARREWQLHPNGATKVASVTIKGETPDIDRELVSLFGDDNVVTKLDGAGQLYAMLGNSCLELKSPERANAELGEDMLAGAPSRGIVAVSVRVNELDAVTAMLDMGRVAHQESKQRVIVPASAAHGVTIEFVESDAPYSCRGDVLSRQLPKRPA